MPRIRILHVFNTAIAFLCCGMYGAMARAESWYWVAAGLWAITGGIWATLAARK